MGLKSLATEEKSGLTVRRLALEVLHAVLEERKTVDEAVERLDGVAELSPRDRGFLMALVFAALRHKGLIDASIAQHLTKPLPRKSGPAQLLLVLGAAQLLFLNSAPHAAIDSSVRLAKEDRGAQHFAGLVNAVLRKVAASGKETLSRLDGPRLNTPSWLWLRWARNFGEDWAQRIAAAHGVQAQLDISVKADAEQWAGRLQGQLLPTGSIRLEAQGAALERLPGFEEGSWWVQDAAAAMPVKLFGDVSGKTALDLCAAPGGKTLQLAAGGAQVTAVDISQARLSRLGANLKRTKLEAQVIASDVQQFAPEQRFDCVLLDAPCSATGTIRRHPELPHIRTPDSIAALVPLQAQMLRHAAKLVKPGGMLIYCVCSLEPEEGEEQILQFLGEGREFQLKAIKPGEAGIPATMIFPKGMLRTLPCMEIGGSSGLDGFFAARLIKSY